LLFIFVVVVVVVVVVVAAASARTIISLCLQFLYSTLFSCKKQCLRSSE
jgi:hypothetical protein